MGFFSWNCKHCGFSVRGVTSFSDIWMKNVVVLAKDASIVFGEYDGYGRVDCAFGEVSICENYPSKISVYHRDCWEIAGRPTDPTIITEHSTGEGFSDSADDQGYFTGGYRSPLSPLAPHSVPAKTFLAELDHLAMMLRTLSDVSRSYCGRISIDETATEINGFKISEVWNEDNHPSGVVKQLMEIRRQVKTLQRLNDDHRVLSELGAKATRVSNLLCECALRADAVLRHKGDVFFVQDMDMYRESFEPDVTQKPDAQDMFFSKAIWKADRILDKIRPLYELTQREQEAA